MRREKAPKKLTLQVVRRRHVLLMQNNLLKKDNGRFKIIEVICTLLHPPFIQLDLHL